MLPSRINPFSNPYNSLPAQDPWWPSSVIPKKNLKITYQHDSILPSWLSTRYMHTHIIWVRIHTLHVYIVCLYICIIILYYIILYYMIYIYICMYVITLVCRGLPNVPFLFILNMSFNQLLEIISSNTHMLRAHTHFTYIYIYTYVGPRQKI